MSELRLEAAIVALNRARVRAAIFRVPRACQFIDDAILLLEAEIVERTFVGMSLDELDLNSLIDDIDPRSEGFA